VSNHSFSSLADLETEWKLETFMYFEAAYHDDAFQYFTLFQYCLSKPLWT